MDGGQYTLLSEFDYEVLWKVIESETLRLHITDVAIQAALFYCRHLGGTDWANRFITKLKSDSKVLQITPEILSAARLSKNSHALDFEDVIEIACLQTYQLEAIVSDTPEYFDNLSVKAIDPEQLLQYVPISFKLWLAYAHQKQRNFTRGWNLQDENLIGLNLSGANLTKINAAGAEMINMNLSGCSLRQADLSQTWLMDADLSNSNLNQANLRGADLSGANCFKTDFTNANVSGANFNHANLEGAKAALVDWDGVDLKEVDTSAVDLVGAKLEDFTVRNISQVGELKQAYAVMTYQTDYLTLDFAQLKQWWIAYPNAIKAIFYKKQIIAGVFLLWPLTEDTAKSLPKLVKEGKFNESALEICASPILRKNQGSRYWYVGGVYLNYSLRNNSNLRTNYLSLLLGEGLKIWLLDEGRYIPKHETLELFTFYPLRQNHPHRYGFIKQPGQVPNKELHKVSVSYADLKLLMQMFNKVDQMEKKKPE